MLFYTAICANMVKMKWYTIHEKWYLCNDKLKIECNKLKILNLYNYFTLHSGLQIFKTTGAMDMQASGLKMNILEQIQQSPLYVFDQ